MPINRIVTLFACLSLLFLTSCQTTDGLTSQLPTQTAPKITQETSPTTTLPTSEATLTHTPSPAITPEKMVLPTDSTIQNQCPEISTQFTPDNFSKGILVFQGRVGLSTLFNLHTGEKKSLDSGSVATVSPSRDHLAYWGLDENDFHRFLVVQTNGDPNQIELPLFDGILAMPSWHDNQHLLFRMTSDPTTDPAPHTIVLLNPFTGEKKFYKPDFPDVDSNVEWDFSGPAVYDQTMDYPIYAGLKDPVNGIHEYILWNKKSQTKIASLPGSTYNGFYLYAGEIIQVDGVSNNPPRWSPDDIRVAIISPASEVQPEIDEIFAITKTGEIQRLTYFANYFRKAQIGKMNWSPDGKNIAFWVTLEPSSYKLPQGAYQDVRLTILNTEMLSMTYYCLAGDSIGLKNGISSAKFLLSDIPAPIWSPDGSQLVIENRYTIDNSRLILLDIPNGKAIEIGKDIEPLGWMVSK